MQPGLDGSRAQTEIEQLPTGDDAGLSVCKRGDVALGGGLSPHMGD